MRRRSGKATKDADELATVSDMYTGEIREVRVRRPPGARDPAAVALGRKGGLKGGKKRMEALTAQERSELAKLAAKKRWQKVKIKVKLKK